MSKIGKTRYGSDYDTEKSIIPIRLLGDRVLIRRDKMDTEEMKSGLIKPGSVKEQYHTGVVVSVGPGYENFPVDVKLNEKVRYNLEGVMDFFIKNENDYDEHFDMLRCADIISVL